MKPCGKKQTEAKENTIKSEKVGERGEYTTPDVSRLQTASTTDRKASLVSDSKAGQDKWET